MTRADPDATASAEAARLCDEGYLFLEAGRFREAHDRLKRACSLDAGNPLIHYRLGLLFGDTGRHREALSCFDEALRLQPDNARAHNNRGSAMQQLGQLDEAEICFRTALALAPDLVPPYVNLGHLLEQRGATAEAVSLYEVAINRGLDGEMFEQYRAAASGRATRASPVSWVRATFNNFAPRFDSHLRALNYRVPQELANRLLRVAHGPMDILDLGCGTGQCGRALASRKRSLVGVDLAEKMLVEAEKQGIYDQLHGAEAHAFLRAAPADSYDLVIAADVFIYIGELEMLFREIGRVLRPCGWLAFSTEEQSGRDYALLPSGRYAQSQAYIERMAGNEFEIVVADSAVIRMENANPLSGRLYLLRRMKTS